MLIVIDKHTAAVVCLRIENTAIHVGFNSDFFNQQKSSMLPYTKQFISVTIICVVFLTIRIMKNWVTDSFIYTTDTLNTSVQIINRSELMLDILPEVPKLEKEPDVVIVQATPEPETPNKEPLPEIPKRIAARLEAANEFRMARDILSGPQMKQFNPGEIPTTAHYVWCGDKCFKFNNYLGILSIVRILEPLRIFFHYNIYPSVNCPFYQTWFQELKQSLPYLVFKKIDRPINCNTMDAVDFALEQMASNKVGGVYVGERAVLTHVPDTWKTGNNFVYQKIGGSNSEEMIVFIKQGIHSKNESDIKQFKNNVLNQTNECYSHDQFEKADQNLRLSYKISPCVFLTRYLIPEEVVNSLTSLSSYLRWLYYGRTDGLHVQQSQDPSDLVPLINHMIYLNPKPGNPVKWNFECYVSVLSALYVGGFERVYVHGDTEPSGKLWDKLKTENVTFVYVDQPYSVFQQDVDVIQHKSDIYRVNILYKYGGAYSDNDVIWVKPLSEEQRRYPTTASYEFTRVDSPRVINNGLIVSKPKAPFLVKVLESFWYFKDEKWTTNSVFMYYKIYERNPETLNIDNRLQVLCCYGICHPTWLPDYRQDWDHPKPTTRINVEEANAFHFFDHKSPETFTSFSALKSHNHVEALLVKRVMAAIERAGRTHLLHDD
ncbi:uncharacterized protein LOC131927250 [Physella acuta]|uniref:uncharacterized protein LOC131927250 n=1 Tax=Physella acuta TaxID=109671 RepID=UPI0027DDC47C|nr:uncharacterized protein LOC131927250 [Physella acuta]